MKVLILLLLFTLSQILIVSCNEMPRGRPTILDDLAVTTDVDENTLLEVPTRPSGAIVVQSNHCGCQNAQPITIGDCDALCAERQSSSDGLAKLFFDVELTEAITLDTFEDVAGWCNTEIIDPNTNEPAALGVGCSLEVKNQAGAVVETIPFDPAQGQVSFSIDITALAEDETFRMTIVEASSGATSTTFQVRRFSDLLQGPSGPLQLMPVNRYSCMIRDVAVVDGSATITNVERFHMYFNSETRPEPLQPGTVSQFYCHDIEIYGSNPINSPLLEETTGVFTLWFKDDPRFYDLLDGDGQMDINNLIYQEVQLQGASLPSVPTLFAPLNWMSAFDDGDATPGGDGGATTTVSVVNKDLGYYMTPFLDDTTYKAYCPTQNHYYSSDPLFKAMKDLVGVGTEALYVAKQDNVTNFLLINESVVQPIWFYIENGQHIQPTTETIQGKQIQFYWPADPSSPYIKKSHQRIYTIKSASELSDSSSNSASGVNGSTNTTGGISNTYPTHDKRIGCVPLLGQ